MFNALRVLIADSLPEVPELAEPITPLDVRVAACAIMIKVAFADGHFTEDERKRISDSLVKHFGVDARGAEEIMSAASRRMKDFPDDVGFTSQLVAEYDRDQRITLAGVLREVASADGWLSGNEDFVLNKFGEWLGLPRSAFTP